MSKYIITNCPCYDHDYEECLNTFRDEYKKCYDCTNCVLKQIVKKCRKSLEVSSCPIEKEILELLDIQEVE